MSKDCDGINLTIVVNTCDAYSDVLKIFFLAFEEFWPDCKYPIVINTEANAHDYPAQVHNFVTKDGKDIWGARLLSTLDSISTDFVLMLYDDFILNASVEVERLMQVLKKISSNDSYAVAYLINTNLPLHKGADCDDFWVVQEKVDYRLNSAPAIWRRKALIKYTGKEDNPWAWEVFGTYRTWGDGSRFLSLNPGKNDIYPYNHDKGGAIYRGKWVRDVVDAVKSKYNLDIDWSIRGYSSDVIFEKRSIWWKVKFIAIGFQMVGYKACNFFIGYFRGKLSGKQ